MTRIYCDSSLRQSCFVINGQEHLEYYPNPVTVNTGEYTAVLKALEYALNRNFYLVKVFTDSLLVVNQVNGVWACRKPHLLLLCDLVRVRLRLLKGTIQWIDREHNPAGLVLEGVR